MLSFLGSKNTRLKLEIEPHRKQPEIELPGRILPMLGSAICMYTSSARVSAPDFQVVICRGFERYDFNDTLSLSLVPLFRMQQVL